MTTDKAPPDSLGRTLQVLAALSPFLLAILTYMLAGSIDRAKVEIDRQRVAIEELKAKAEELRVQADANSIRIRTQAEKVTVIMKLIEDLTGPKEDRRRVAIQALRIVLPEEESVAVLSALQRTAEPGSANAEQIQSVLDRDRSRLVAEMFASDRAVRAEALRSLRQAWRADAAVIGLLLDRAAKDVEQRRAAGFPAAVRPATDPDTQRRASIYNTVLFLTEASTPDPDLRLQIRAFADSAVQNSDDTARLVKTLQERFR